MKEQPSAFSPFAALDTREQMEQWIWWQCQHPKDETKGRTDIDPQVLPELKAEMPQKEQDHQAVKDEKPVSVSMPPIRHGQYDAVLRRMNAAGKRTSAYIPWTE